MLIIILSVIINTVNMIRIILTEDNAVVRKGLVELLEDQDDFEIVGTAANGIEALTLLKDGLKADILLADLNMPGMDGITLTTKICSAQPDISLLVIILTMHERSDFVERALNAGAKGYLLKNGNFDDVFTGIRKVYDGEVYITADLKH